MPTTNVKIIIINVTLIIMRIENRANNALHRAMLHTILCYAHIISFAL